jgi:hypothetical protein
MNIWYGGANAVNNNLPNKVDWSQIDINKTLESKENQTQISNMSNVIENGKKMWYLTGKVVYDGWVMMVEQTKWWFIAFGEWLDKHKNTPGLLLWYSIGYLSQAARWTIKALGTNARTMVESIFDSRWVQATTTNTPTNKQNPEPTSQNTTPAQRTQQTVGM